MIQFGPCNESFALASLQKTIDIVKAKGRDAIAKFPAIRLLFEYRANFVLWKFCGNESNVRRQTIDMIHGNVSNVLNWLHFVGDDIFLCRHMHLLMVIPNLSYMMRTGFPKSTVQYSVNYSHWLEPDAIDKLIIIWWEKNIILFDRMNRIGSVSIGTSLN